jgi:hypothetical protein
MTPREEVTQARLRMGQLIGRWELTGFDLDADRGAAVWVELIDGPQRRIIRKSTRGAGWLVEPQTEHPICGWMGDEDAPALVATFAAALEVVRAA